MFQGLAERRKPLDEVGVLRDHRRHRGQVRVEAAHVSDQMDDRIAGADVEIELVERDAAVILEVLLDFDLDVVAREVAAKLIAIRAELVGNGGEENPNGHGCKVAAIVA